MTGASLRWLVVFSCWWCGQSRADLDAGLAAHYSFEEGGGPIAHDASGNHNDAKINGCLFVKGVNGFCMDVNGAGKGQYLDCGDLDIDGPLTISVWIFPYLWSDKEWSGIVYKSDATYGLRNNYKKPGQIHFRVGGADLMSSTRLKPKRWYHLAAVYEPGKFRRLYINGVLDARSDRAPAKLATDDAPLLIGASGQQFFCGRIDEVRIYQRALSEAEIKDIFATDPGGKMVLGPRAKETASPAATLKGDGFAVKLFPRGGMEVVLGGQSFRIASSYSAPGKYRNHLSLGPSGLGVEEPGWNPVVQKAAGDEFTVVAKGRHYQLTRRVKVGAKRIEVADTFTNLSDDDVGIILAHEISGPQPLEDWYLYGVEKATGPPDGRTPAINPTCFIAREGGSIGLAVEDQVLRSQLEAQVSAPMGTITMGSRHFGLPKGRSYTTAWAIYPAPGGYFDFINRLRADWRVPEVTIPGPASFVRVASWSSANYREVWAKHPDKFKAHLDRKNVKLFLIAPWYRYWDGFDYSKQKFTKMAQDAMKTIRSVVPDAKFLGCLETYYYFLPRSILGDTVPQAWEQWSKMPHEFALPAAATAVLDKTVWKDSVWRDPRGNIRVSRGDPGPDSNYKTPPLCLLVYPEIGNHFFKLRMQEIEFLIDEVGFDGVYMDMFGYGQNFSYDKWDGHTVDISADGRITRKYSHLALVTAEARYAWLKRILDKGKIALVNFGQPNTPKLQQLPYLSFVEGAYIGHVDLESPIPDSSGVAGCQLTTPIALSAGKDKTADQALARVRAFLRYGVVYYHYYLRTMFPREGPGSGEYGPINHMFPITPVRLGKGFVEGRERIITTVSHTFLWRNPEAPRVLLFDRVGREKSHHLTPQKTEGGWRVEVKLADWKDIAVIESR